MYPKITTGLQTVGEGVMKLTVQEFSILSLGIESYDLYTLRGSKTVEFGAFCETMVCKVFSQKGYIFIKN